MASVVEAQPDVSLLPDSSAILEAISNKRKQNIQHGVRDDRYSQLAPIREARKKLSQLSNLEREAAIKVPLDALAKEWLSTVDIDLNLKKFLVESLLPTLVIGLEKLMNEVTLRELVASTEEQEDFNPVNYLAQFLMRNNPLYTQQNWDHSYVKAMRQATEDIKKLLGSLENKKVEELRERSKERCQERERQAAAKMEEESRKVQQLISSYCKWLCPGEKAPPLSEMKTALQSWVSNLQMECVKKEAQVFVASLSSALLGQFWEEKDFTRGIVKLGLPVNPFQELVNHMAICGVDRKRRFMREKRCEQIQAVFEHCTFTTNSSTVDRLRVVYLLTLYYDSQPKEVQQLVLNPREWPIMEVVEVEELEEEEEHQRLSSGAVSTLSRQDLKEFLEDSVESQDAQGVVSPSAIEGGGGASVERVPTSDDALPQDSEAKVLKERPDEHAALSEAHHVMEEGGGDSTSAPPQVECAPPTTSLLQQRLLTSSATRVKSLKRMRFISGMSPRGMRQPTGPGGSWDHEQLTKGQFVVLLDQFIGLEPEETILNSLLTYIKDYYKETVEEQRDRLEQAEQVEQQVQHRKCIEELFQLWDSHLAGFIDLNDFVNTLIKWKGFENQEALNQAQIVLEGMGVEHSRLSRQQFCSYLDQVTAQMDHTHFLSLTDFLRTSVQLTQEEEKRCKLRRQWLGDLVKDGKTSDLKLGTALKNAILIVHQDVVEFGGSKQVMVVVSLLQKTLSKTTTDDGGGSTQEPPLRVNAASQSLQPDIIGSTLTRDSKDGVSFQALDDGRPVHVTNIRSHGKVHFYLPQHDTKQFDGSLVVVPVCIPPGNSVGVISIDTLQYTTPTTSESTQGRTLTSSAKSGAAGRALPSASTSSSTSLPGLVSAFHGHEILFYEGVGQSVGIVHHWITCRLSLLRVSLSALRWIHNHCPAVKQGEVYLVTTPPTTPLSGKAQPDPFLLHLMLSTTPSAPPITKINKRVNKQDSPFKTYLFECVEMSEPFSTEIFGERHMVHPIRDNTGCAVALVDLTLTPIQTLSLDRGQLREITKVLNLLTSTFYYLSSSWEEPRFQLEEEVWRGLKQQLTDTEDIGSVGSDTDFNSLFNELILEDLRKRMQRIDNMVFAELRSYVDPPELVLQVVQALHNLLNPDKKCETWMECKQMITVSMVRAMKEYNPLRVPQHPKLATIKNLITSVPVSAVYEHGSLPTKLIHLWIRACIPILEHSAASVIP